MNNINIEMKKVVPIVLFLVSSLAFSQAKSPLYLPSLPYDIKFEFINSKPFILLKKGKGQLIKSDVPSDCYFLKRNDNNIGICIKTEGFKDVVLTFNGDDGGDIYEKMGNNTFKKILEIRKVINKFKISIVSVDNIPIYKMETEFKDGIISAAANSYSLYHVGVFDN